MATSLAADGMLELSTLKVYLLCREDFEEAVSQGTTGPKLFAICGMLRLNLRADVEANEGYNSLIRITTERAKHIGLPLLAARCNTKAALGIACRGAASKWSAIRPAAEAALLDVVDHCFAGEVVMDDATRWLTPNSTATLPTKKELQRSAIRFHPHLRPSARLLFSAHNNLLLHRAQKHVNIRWGFAFAPDLLTTPVYVSPEKNYSLAMCVECHVIQSNETSILRVRRPFSFCSSADLMATFYREDPAAVNASLFQVELSWQVSPEHGLHAVVSGVAPLFQLENKHLTVPTSHQPHQSSGESRQDAGTDVEQRAGGVRHPDQPSGPARDPSAEEAFGLLHGLGLSADEIDDWLEDIQAASLQSEADGNTQAWMATDKADADEEAAVRRQAALATAMDEQRTKSGTKRKRGGRPVHMTAHPRTYPILVMGSMWSAFKRKSFKTIWMRLLPAKPIMFRMISHRTFASLGLSQLLITGTHKRNWGPRFSLTGLWRSHQFRLAGATLYKCLSWQHPTQTARLDNHRPCSSCTGVML